MGRHATRSSGLQRAPLVIVALLFGCGGDAPEPRTAEPAVSSEIGESDAQAAPAPSSKANRKAEGEPDLAAEDSPSVAEPSGVPEITFPLLDQVRSLDLVEPYMGFPEALLQLDGKEVQLIGFMAPFDSLENMRRCMIVPTYVGCTFCSPPDLTQVVYVTQGDGDTAGKYPYVDTVAHVRGTLRLSVPPNEHEGALQGFIYSLENAVVTERPGDTEVRTASHATSPHQSGTIAVEAAPVDQVVAEVVELLGREPLEPITVEAVSGEVFAQRIRGELEAVFPAASNEARAHAFRALGLLPEGAGWIESMSTFQLSRRAALASGSGKTVSVLGSISTDDPYVRLDLVGEIAVAIMRQHEPLDRAVARSSEEGTSSGLADDERRARESLMEGFRTMVIRRYATARGIPTSPAPPPEIESKVEAFDFGRWQATTRYCGYFFVRAVIGDTGPLSGIAAAFEQPPTMTMELFRPSMSRDVSRWKPDPVPAGFADGLDESAPALTDVLGVGGVVPFLAQWYSLDEALGYVGGWTGDRWAVWPRPDGSAKFAIELRWRTEEDALRFRDCIPDGAGWKLAPHEDGRLSVLMTRGE